MNIAFPNWKAIDADRRILLLWQLGGIAYEPHRAQRWMNEWWHQKWSKPGPTPPGPGYVGMMKTDGSWLWVKA